MNFNNAISVLVFNSFVFRYSLRYYEPKQHMEKLPMMKKHEIYKKDKWNMMTVEVQGRYIVLREISDDWGEEAHTFMSRPAMMQWAQQRFDKEAYAGNEEEWERIMNAFKQV